MTYAHTEQCEKDNDFLLWMEEEHSREMDKYIQEYEKATGKKFQ